MPAARQGGRSYTSRVAVIMLVVLGVSVAGAYWLVYTRTEQPEQVGREIIAEIRRQGLEHYWGNEETLLRLVRRDNRSVTRSWHRKPADGRYRGRIEFDGPEGASRETWELSDDLSTGRYQTGRYQGEAIRLRRGMIEQVPPTTIALRNGRVEVTRGGDKADAEIPANYMPEGTAHLVARKVVQRGERAAFRIILNAVALSPNGQVQFTRMLMTPLSQRRVEIRITVGARPQKTVIEFDDEWRVVRYTVTPPQGEPETYVRTTTGPAAQRRSGLTRARPARGFPDASAGRGRSARRRRAALARAW
ncbi:MAG: hypothetical protein ACOC8F_07135 [Planctomycetota bacterium]